MNETHAEKLSFFATMPHACSYLPEQEAVTLFADPDVPVNTEIYGQLIDFGFRRSGAHIYRPRCPHCTACVPVRVPVDSFLPNRSQRRNLVKNRDIEVTPVDACFHDEHFDLYRRYIGSRHTGGGMDDPSIEKYMEFLVSPYISSYFFEFRCQGKLLAVAVTDSLPQGLSAVYTFYEPEEARRGLGVFSVLWEIQETARLRLPWLYLGYWIEQSPKMNYKINYQPIETYIDSQWVTRSS